MIAFAKVHPLMVLIIQIILLLIVPVVGVTFSIPIQYKEIILISVVIVVCFLAFYQQMSLKEVGLRLDNIRQSIIPYSLLTVGGIVFLLFLVLIFDKKPLPNWQSLSHLQWAFLPISISQEFVYRGYFQTRLQRLIKPYLAIVVISIIYSGMHIIWKDPLILLITFIGGIGWSILWYKFPNLILLSISHAILNYIAVFYGFFASHLGD